jgi:hypothetical protein
MKKLLILTLILVGCYSCIKKKALKYDPELVGTWVANEDNVNTWLIIEPDGNGEYSTYGNDEGTERGEVKYSLFERKMWVGDLKFKVTTWWTAKLDGVGELKTKEYGTLKDTTYQVDLKMIMKSSGVLSGRSITFYRIIE